MNKKGLPLGETSQQHSTLTIFFFRINLFQQFLFLMIYPGVTFAFRTWLVSWIIQLSLIPWIFFSFANPLSQFSKKMTTWASLCQSISPFLSCKGCTTIFSADNVNLNKFRPFSTTKWPMMGNFPRDTWFMVIVNFSALWISHTWQNWFLIGSCLYSLKKRTN